MAAPSALSPRLACLCADHIDIRNAILAAGLSTTLDMCGLPKDPDVAADRLRLDEPSRVHFRHIFSIIRKRAEDTDAARMSQVLDVLNAEGDVIMRKTRLDVHRGGFWHRAVNVWVLCPSTSRVLLGQRAATKDMHPLKWTCVCSRVPSGELSMNCAVARLNTEFAINAEADRDISLIFRLKCAKDMTNGVFAGHQDAAWIDVYVACFDEEIPIEMLHVDVEHKVNAKYVTVAELEKAYKEHDEGFVQPPEQEYCKRLLFHLKKICRDHAMETR